MGRDGSLWACMALYWCVWLYIGVDGSLWLLMTPNVSALHGMGVDGYIWVGMALYWSIYES